MAAISALPVRHHHVEHADEPLRASCPSKVTASSAIQSKATGQGDKAGGKSHNANKVICFDRTTFAALGTWRS